MRVRRHGRLCVTERDKCLFQYLFITKGATRTQVHRDIFAEASKPVVHERLKKLSKYGLISEFPALFEGSKTAYRLTEKAFAEYNVFIFKPQRLELKSPHPNHDFSLIEIRNSFLKAKGCVHYLTENQLQSGFFGGKNFNYDRFIRLRSDAFLHIKIGKGKYSGAIEFEQTAKSKMRYVELFSQYYWANDVAFVFYVVSQKRLLSLIWEMDKRIKRNKDSKIFGLTYQDLKNSTNLIVVKNSDNGILEIDLEQDS